MGEKGSNMSRGIFNSDRTMMAKFRGIVDELALYPVQERIDLLNEMKQELHKCSPMKDEPVDCVVWLPNEIVNANDYNPNSVAPPEMKLLEHSITEDGYTQPVVAWKNGEAFEVVDGFHRTRVSKESAKVQKRVHGRVPVTIINAARLDRNDRIASTIRHNRARGKHRVDSMSNIVVELKRRNWSDEKIARELGMDADEILRLCQVSGLAELFANQEFSKAWDLDTADETVVAEEVRMPE